MVLLAASSGPGHGTELSERLDGRGEVCKLSVSAVTRLGIIGERFNPISLAVLRRLLRTERVRVEWFVEADPSPALREALLGPRFAAGGALRVARAILRGRRGRGDCRAVCARASVEYLRPRDQSINTGLPSWMYGRSGVEST